MRAPVLVLALTACRATSGAGTPPAEAPVLADSSRGVSDGPGASDSSLAMRADDRAVARDALAAADGAPDRAETAVLGDISGPPGAGGGGQGSGPITLGTVADAPLSERPAQQPGPAKKAAPLPADALVAGPLDERDGSSLCPEVGPSHCSVRFELARFMLQVEFSPDGSDVIAARGRLRASEHALLACAEAARRRDPCVREGLQLDFRVTPYGPPTPTGVRGLADAEARACVAAIATEAGLQRMLPRDAGARALRLRLVYVPAHEQSFVSHDGDISFGPLRSRNADPPCRDVTGRAG
ncbi:hypothetical protein [Nannocystis exedens]|nr:hypothetical protein [Nannocystis exedens]